MDAFGMSVDACVVKARIVIWWVKDEGSEKAS